MVGFLTFPIMTRNLSVDDYGIVGLITASIALFVAFGKLGMQHSIVRYYAEAMQNKRYNLITFQSTVVSLFLILSLITMAIWLFAGTFVLPHVIENKNITKYFWIASLFILLRMVGSVTWNMLRARQHSADVSYSTMLGRGSYLLMLLLLLAFKQVSLTFVLIAFVLAELAAVLYAAYAFKPFWSYRASAFSPDLTKRLLRFGLPLMALESLSLLLRMIDRYMIGAVLGDNELGLYSASYNLVSYLEIIFIASLAGAVRPMYTQIWESEGPQATKAFLSKSLHNYWMLGIPCITVFILLAPDLLIFLASDRYSAGTAIIPYIACVFLLDGALIFLSAGVYFLGSTKTFLAWGLLAGFINVLGNYFAIPHFGIEGAASVTLCSFIIFTTGVVNNALRLLTFNLSWKKPALILIASVAASVVFNRAFVDNGFVNMAIKGMLASICLLIVLLLIDKDLKNWLHSQVTTRLKR